MLKRLLPPTLPGACALLALWTTSSVAGTGQFPDGGFDAHGAPPTPGDGSPTDPMWSWRPRQYAPGTWSVGTVFEFVESPVYVRDLGVEDPNADDALLVVIDDMAAANLSAFFTIHKRIGVGMTLPLWLTTTGRDEEDLLDPGLPPATGDMHLWVPINIRSPWADGTGFGLSIVPWADLPTGAEARLLGEPGIGGGALLAGGLGVGKLRLVANGGAGYAAQPSEQAASLAVHGGPALYASGSAAWRFNDRLAMHVEGRYRYVGDPTRIEELLTESDDPDVRQELLLSPSDLEGALSLKYQHASGFWFATSAGTAAPMGVVAPAFRGYLGVGWQHSPKTTVEIAARPSDDFTFVVQTPQGEPIPGAVINVGGEPVGETDGAGRVTLSGL